MYHKVVNRWRKRCETKELELEEGVLKIEEGVTGSEIVNFIATIY